MCTLHFLLCLRHQSSSALHAVFYLIVYVIKRSVLILVILEAVLVLAVSARFQRHIQNWPFADICDFKDKKKQKGD